MVSIGQQLEISPRGAPNARAGVETVCLRDLLAAQPSTAPQRAACHVIMLVTTGHGSHALDFVRYPCRPGTLLWGRPGQVHQFGREAGFDATLLAIEPAALPELPELTRLRDLVDDPFATTCWQPTGEDQEAIVAEMSQIAVDSARYASGYGDEIGEALLRHQLAVLLVRMAALAPAPSPGTAAELVARLRAELARDIMHRRVEDYAEALGCSVRTLTRACLAATGRSAKQLVDERVALEAKRLLATTDLPVAEVGRQLGFDEPTNFGRFFARETDQTPGAFRAAATRRPPRPAIPGPRSALPGRLAPLARSNGGANGAAPGDAHGHAGQTRAGQRRAADRRPAHGHADQSQATPPTRAIRSRPR
jgi:AraC-like DNA-binding protein